MKQDPFFSIIIVNYNHGSFIESSIQSILRQDCNDYEIILIDGGSNDQSLSIINSYSKFFSYWISERDSGQSNALNKGFAKAKGEFVFWLNADDILLPNTLRKVKSFLTKNINCDWLAGNTILFNNDYSIKSCIRGPRFVKYLVENGTVYVYGPSSFFRRKLFSEIGGFDESLHYTMDTDLWYRFVTMGYKFSRIDHYCWGLRVHEDSKTSHAFSGKANDNFTRERIYIQKKNSHKLFKHVQILLIIFKFVSGIFFRKLFDNFRLINKNILELR